MVKTVSCGEDWYVQVLLNKGRRKRCWVNFRNCDLNTVPSHQLFMYLLVITSGMPCLHRVVEYLHLPLRHDYKCTTHVTPRFQRNGRMICMQDFAGCGGRKIWSTCGTVDLQQFRLDLFSGPSNSKSSRPFPFNPRLDQESTTKVLMICTAFISPNLDKLPMAGQEFDLSLRHVLSLSTLVAHCDH